MAHTSGRIRFATAGVEPGQAPVSGGEPGAVEASLSIMVGGEAADFEAAKPVLEAVGKTIVHVGPAGSGQTVNRESAHRRRQHRTTGRGHRVPRSLRCGHRGSRRDVSRRSASSITCTSRWYSAQSSPTKIIDPSPFGKAVQPLSSPRTPGDIPIAQCDDDSRPR
jgi:hypothetical protein